MHFESYGNAADSAIVFLHGANFVHSFGRQYVLAEDFHLLVPHIMGYGEEAEKVFECEKAADALLGFVRGLGKKVTLVGFSLGAQLAVKLTAEHPELFERAVFVSPLLIKTKPVLDKLEAMNLKQLKSMKKPWLCRLIGLMNGLPKKQRLAFVESMQKVSFETQRNMVYNGISLETLTGFSRVKLPMLAIAGAKEPSPMIESVRALGEMNPRCRVEIWPKAAHNIPPLFAKQFNARLKDFMDEKPSA